MTIRQQTSAKALGKRLAEIVSERNLPVQEIRVRDTAEGPTLWILTEPMELKDELPIHEVFVELHRCFPDSYFDDHVINPEWCSGCSGASLLPAGTKKVVLQG